MSFQDLIEVDVTEALADRMALYVSDEGHAFLSVGHRQFNDGCLLPRCSLSARQLLRKPSRQVRVYVLVHRVRQVPCLLNGSFCMLRYPFSLSVNSILCCCFLLPSVFPPQKIYACLIFIALCFSAARSAAVIPGPYLPEKDAYRMFRMDPPESFRKKR